MTAGLLRVSVVAGSRRLDLAVPPALPVAELVPGLARRLGMVSYDGLRLLTATGTVLDDRTGLAPQEVPDGAVLALAPPPPPPTLHDDPAEALAALAPPGGVPHWWPLPAAAALLVLGGLTLASAPQARTAVILALLLLAAAVGLARASSAAALLASLAASGYAALAAAWLAPDLRPGPGVAWAAAGGAVLAVSSLAMTALPSHRLLLVPGLVVGAAAAVVGAVLALRDIPLAVLGSVLLALGAVVAGGAPWLAVGRISRPRSRVDLDALVGEARTARELLLGLTAGLAAVHLALVPVVARSGVFGIALSATASTFLLLRGRHPCGAAALPGLLAGSIGLLATATVALWLHVDWRPVGAWVLAGVGGVLLASQRLHGDSGLLLPLLLRWLETACLVAVVPLVVLATGVLGTLR